MGRAMACATLLCLVVSLTALSTVSAATNITYTTDAAELTAIWVDANRWEVLGGAKAPKLTGSASGCGIIYWDPEDDHYLRHSANVTAVLSTGDVKWTISKDPYDGGDQEPSYPNIEDSKIKV